MENHYAHGAAARLVVAAVSVPVCKTIACAAGGCRECSPDAAAGGRLIATAEAEISTCCAFAEMVAAGACHQNKNMTL